MLLHLAVVLLTATALTSGQEWTHIPGKLTHVSGSITYVWGVNKHQQIFMCKRPCTGSNWKHIPGALIQVDVDDTHVWGVNANHDVYNRPIDGSGNWKCVTGLKLKHVSASGHGFMWGVNGHDNIFKCEKPKCDVGSNWVKVDGLLKQIDGGAREVYGVNSNNYIFARPVDGSGNWRHIPGTLKHISASGTYDVYGVNRHDVIFRCRKPCIAQWEVLSGRLSQCDAGPNALFGVNSNDDIFRRNIPL